MQWRERTRYKWYRELTFLPYCRCHLGGRGCVELRSVGSGYVCGVGQVDTFFNRLEVANIEIGSSMVNSGAPGGGGYFVFVSAGNETNKLYHRTVHTYEV